MANNQPTNVPHAIDTGFDWTFYAAGAVSRNFVHPTNGITGKLTFGYANQRDIMFAPFPVFGYPETWGDFPFFSQSSKQALFIKMSAGVDTNPGLAFESGVLF